jgi:hypothetical protein
MTEKIRLNPLQARTLLLLQELAKDERFSKTDEDTGEVAIHHLPHAHGDHMHIGRFSVSGRFASGLSNEAVWVALARKGLAQSYYPHFILLTKNGLAFDTGLAGEILEESDH